MAYFRTYLEHNYCETIEILEENIMQNLSNLILFSRILFNQSDWSQSFDYSNKILIRMP